MRSPLALDADWIAPRASPCCLAETTDGQVKALDASIAVALEHDIEIAFKATPEDEHAALQAAIDNLGEVKASSRAGLSSA